MTRNVSLNQRELGLILSVFEGQPQCHEKDGEAKLALYRRFRSAYGRVESVNEVIDGMPEEFRGRVYDRYHATKGKIPAIKLVYEYMGKTSLRTAKDVTESIGGDLL